jgi:hypothetical protein
VKHFFNGDLQHFSIFIKKRKISVGTGSPVSYYPPPSQLNIYLGSGFLEGKSAVWYTIIILTALCTEKAFPRAMFFPAFLFIRISGLQLQRSHPIFPELQPW